MASLTKFNTNRSPEEGKRIQQARLKDSKYIYEKYKDKLNMRSCPCCKSKDFDKRESFHNTWCIVECINCKTEYVNPVPSEEALYEYYSMSQSSKLIRGVWERRKIKSESNHIVDYRLKLLKKIIKENFAVLEIGTGSGVFLEKLNNYFKELNLSLSGIDLDMGAVELAQEKGLNVTHANIEKYENW